MLCETDLKRLHTDTQFRPPCTTAAGNTGKHRNAWTSRRKETRSDMTTV